MRCTCTRLVHATFTFQIYLTSIISQPGSCSCNFSVSANGCRKKKVHCGFLRAPKTNLQRFVYNRPLQMVYNLPPIPLQMLYNTHFAYSLLRTISTAYIFTTIEVITLHNKERQGNKILHIINREITPHRNGLLYVYNIFNIII